MSPWARDWPRYGGLPGIAHRKTPKSRGVGIWKQSVQIGSGLGLGFSVARPIGPEPTVEKLGTLSWQLTCLYRRSRMES
jgi:hypothetical protein